MLRVETVAGKARVAAHQDGPNGTSRLSNPCGICFDLSSNLVIADSENHAIRKLSPSEVLTTFAGQPGKSGNVNGSLLEARFDIPFGVAADSLGNIFVADQRNNSIRKISGDGIVTTLCEDVEVPKGVAVDRFDRIFVAACGGNKILLVTQTGLVTVLAGNFMLSSPSSVAVTRLGNVVVVADTYNNDVRKIFLDEDTNTITKPKSFVTSSGETAGFSEFLLTLTLCRHPLRGGGGRRRQCDRGRQRPTQDKEDQPAGNRDSVGRERRWIERWAERSGELQLPIWGRRGTSWDFRFGLHKLHHSEDRPVPVDKR